MSYHFRKKRPPTAAYQHQLQENLDNVVSSIQVQLELYEKLKSLVDDLPGDTEMLAALTDSRTRIRNNVAQLKQSGYSVVDLVSRFGTTLFKGALADAETSIAKKEADSGGQFVVTDLVQEDDILRNRADQTQYTKQLAADLGLIGTVRAQFSWDKIMNSTRYRLLKDAARDHLAVRNRLAEEEKKRAEPVLLPPVPVAPPAHSPVRGRRGSVHSLPVPRAAGSRSPSAASSSAADQEEEKKDPAAHDSISTTEEAENRYFEQLRSRFETATSVAGLPAALRDAVKPITADRGGGIAHAKGIITRLKQAVRSVGNLMSPADRQHGLEMCYEYASFLPKDQVIASIVNRKGETVTRQLARNQELERQKWFTALIDEELPAPLDSQSVSSAFLSAVSRQLASPIAVPKKEPELA